MSFERGRHQSPQSSTREDNVVYDDCKRLLSEKAGLKEIPTRELIKYADDIGKDLAKEKKVKMSQLRKVLDAFEKVRSEVRRGKEKVDVREEVQPLKIHLAYAAGRQPVLESLQRVLNMAIDKVSDEEDFKKLSQFIEGLVAYHKFYGGAE